MYENPLVYIHSKLMDFLDFRKMQGDPFDIMGIRKSMKIGSSIATPNGRIPLISVKCKGGHGKLRAGPPAGRPGPRPRGGPFRGWATRLEFEFWALTDFGL